MAALSDIAVVHYIRPMTAPIPKRPLPFGDQGKLRVLSAVTKVRAKMMNADIYRPILPSRHAALHPKDNNGQIATFAKSPRSA